MATRKAPIRRKAEGNYHHGDLKTALKRAALRLVRNKGPRGFSLNEASRLAGVTVGAPYRHFADKDALLAEVACEGYELLREALEAAVQVRGSATERLVAAGMAYLEFAGTHTDYFAVMFRAGLDQRRYAAMEDAGKAAYAVLERLAEEVEGGAGQSADRALTAWALVHGLATLAADGALPPELTAGHAARLRPVLERSLAAPRS